MSRDTHVEHAPLQPPAEVRIAAIAVYIPPIVVSQEEVSSLCKIPLEDN